MQVKMTQEEHRAKLTFNYKLHDPCLKEHNQSLSCLSENQEDREKCRIYFLNYKHCLKFWGDVKKERIRNGINPALPPLEEREQIKREYFESYSKK